MIVIHIKICSMISYCPGILPNLYAQVMFSWKMAQLSQKIGLEMVICIKNHLTIPYCFAELIWLHIS